MLDLEYVSAAKTINDTIVNAIFYGLKDAENSNENTYNSTLAEKITEILTMNKDLITETPEETYLTTLETQYSTGTAGDEDYQETRMGINQALNLLRSYEENTIRSNMPSGHMSPSANELIEIDNQIKEHIQGECSKILSTYQSRIEGQAEETYLNDLIKRHSVDSSNNES